MPLYGRTSAEKIQKQCFMENTVFNKPRDSRLKGVQLLEKRGRIQQHQLQLMVPSPLAALLKKKKRKKKTYIRKLLSEICLNPQ